MAFHGRERRSSVDGRGGRARDSVRGETRRTAIVLHGAREIPAGASRTRIHVLGSRALLPPVPKCIGNDFRSPSGGTRVSFRRTAPSPARPSISDPGRPPGPVRARRSGAVFRWRGRTRERSRRRRSARSGTSAGHGPPGSGPGRTLERHGSPARLRGGAICAIPHRMPLWRGGITRPPGGMRVMTGIEPDSTSNGHASMSHAPDPCRNRFRKLGKTVSGGASTGGTRGRRAVVGPWPCDERDDA